MKVTLLLPCGEVEVDLEPGQFDAMVCMVCGAVAMQCGHPERLTAHEVLARAYRPPLQG